MWHSTGNNPETVALNVIDGAILSEATDITTMVTSGTTIAITQNVIDGMTTQRKSDVIITQNVIDGMTTKKKSDVIPSPNVWAGEILHIES
jgi:hypothetical protein